VQTNGLKDRVEIVITIRTSAGDMQTQVDLRKGWKR